MDHTVVHFEIPADEPERAAKFYREFFGWEISRWGGSADGGESAEYWMLRAVPTDAEGQPTRPGVNGGLSVAEVARAATIMSSRIRQRDDGGGRQRHLRLYC